MNVPRTIEQIGWPARRANPALTYLIERRLVEHSNEVTWPLVADHIWKTPKTRRFVRQNHAGKQPALAFGSRLQDSSLTFYCLQCGSTKFEMPEDPKGSDAVTCAGCRATTTHSEIQTEMTRQGKAHLDKVVSEALGPLFKRR